MNDAAKLGRVDDVAETIGRDLLLAIVTELKTLKKPFEDLDERGQSDSIMRCTTAVRAQLSRGFSLIVGGGFAHAPATLEKVAFTPKGVQGTVSLAPASEYRHALSDHAGHGVIIVLASVENYLQRMNEVRAEKDQPQLNFGQDTSGFDSPRHELGEGAAVPPDLAIVDDTPLFDVHDGPFSIDVTADIMALAGIDADQRLIAATWSQEFRADVIDFCAALALKEAGGDVHVPSRPEALGEGGR
jgi:hypothetical protein